MGRIQVLDEHIANQIAAGEVVERPSSVVKELVENAIDAGSTRIDVVIEEGGLQLIRVTDNGSGMDSEDCETAFFRHATSKISSGKDLFAIRTLGFRGEALPSIAAVAKVECISSSATTGLGRRLAIEGGSVKALEDVASPRGTDIAVRQLFYNTPARLKYMKTIQTELGHVSDYMYRLALAHPNVAFTLRHNGGTLLHTLGNGDLLQVVAAIYGTSIAKGMLPVRGESLDYRISGFISKPDLTRSNRNAISTVINGRYIRNYVLIQALLQGYHTLLPINRYPIAVLHIDMDPELVDVNVHPSKLEVRFSKEQELIQFVQGEVKRLFGGQTLIPSGAPQPKPKPAYIQEQMELYRPGPETAAPAGAQSGQAAARADEPAGGQPEWVWPEGAQPAGQIVNAKAAELTASSGGESTPADAAGGNAQNGEQSVHVPGSGERASLRDEPQPFGEKISAEGQRSGSVRPDRSEGADVKPGQDRYEWGGLLGGRTAAADLNSIAPERRQTERTAAESARQERSSSDRSAAEWSGSGRSASSRSGAGQAETAKGSPQAAESFMKAAAPAEDEPPSLPPFPSLTPIGQLHGTYIVAQNEEGLFLMDQHAAHERINYEKYFDAFGKPADASQQLLVPITLEFTSAEAGRLREKLHLFEQAGVYLESFGGNTFIVRAYPHWMPEGDEQSIIEEMADWLLTERKAIDVAKLREKAAIMCSCKASIKANQSLSILEMEALFDKLAACRNPYTCPHGRPIVISFSTYELEKMFKRVM